MIIHFETMLKAERAEGKKYQYVKYPKGAKESGIRSGYQLV